jgi:hypothetical protein
MHLDVKTAESETVRLCWNKADFQDAIPKDAGAMVSPIGLARA